MRRALAAALATLALWSGMSGIATAEPRDLDPKLDNPPGCKTATTEEDDGCGAQGRDHFASAKHKPPIEACKDTRSPAGSLVTRMVPEGPRRADGKLAFTSGACVYLPPGYSTSGLRYPVLYLLHGGGGDQSDWVSQGDIQKMVDERVAKNPADALIVVMPDGRSGQWYDSYDNKIFNEKYFLDFVIPYFDARLRTIADRKGRAVAGLSNGGYGTMHFAARRPDLFVAAGAMSSNLGAYGFRMGSQVDGPAYYPGKLPEELAINLDGVDLTLDIAASCMSDITVDLCATLAVDAAFIAANRGFNDKLKAVGHKGALEYRETEGSHAWRWWTKWLRERHLPFIQSRLLDPTKDKVTASTPPPTFRYRTVAERFSVWGYDFATTRKVREFVELTEVGATGLTAKGSGTIAVTTAPVHDPGATYKISGAGPQPIEAIADNAGRLRFVVDMGPSHTDEQYSVAARPKEAAGGYFQSRAVRIELLGRRTAGAAQSPARSRTTPGRARTTPASESLPATGGPLPAMGAALLLAMSFALRPLTRRGSHR